LKETSKYKISLSQDTNSSRRYDFSGVAATQEKDLFSGMNCSLVQFIMKKTFVAVLVVIFIVILGGGGLGFLNGSRIKSYAKEIKKMMDESNEKWNTQTVENTDSPEQMKEKLGVVKLDCQERLAELERLKAPAKAKNLQIKTKDYFETAGKMADEVIPIIDYYAVLEEVGNDLENIDQGLGGTNYLNQMNTMHKRLKKDIEKLEATTPPEIYKDTHEQIVAGLKELDELLVKGAAYLASNNLAALASLSTELQATLNKLNQIEAPSVDALNMDEIFSPADQEKIDKLPDEIKTEANELEKTRFYLLGLSF